MPEELEFYKRHNLPNLKRHPDMRHEDRVKRRNSYQLRETDCKKCGKQTCTDNQEDGLIYCHEWYLIHVY